MLFKYVNKLVKTFEDHLTNKHCINFKILKTYLQLYHLVHHPKKKCKKIIPNSSLNVNVINKINYLYSNKIDINKIYKWINLNHK